MTLNSNLDKKFRQVKINVNGVLIKYDLISLIEFIDKEIEEINLDEINKKIIDVVQLLTYFRNVGDIIYREHEETKRKLRLSRMKYWKKAKEEFKKDEPKITDTRVKELINYKIKDCRDLNDIVFDLDLELNSVRRIKESLLDIQRGLTTISNNRRERKESI